MLLTRLHAFIALLLIASFAEACELTEEYKSARTIYVQESQRAYTECISSVSNADHWYKYVQCIEAGDGKNIGGGCGHLVAFPNDRYKSLGISNDFCSVLKPTTEIMKKGFEEYIRREGIEKCKET